METKNQFTCSLCGETYDKEWSDEEAWAEAHELWTEEEIAGGTDVICDDCHKKFMAWRNNPLKYFSSAYELSSSAD